MSRAESFHLHAPDARSPLKREALLIILSAQGFEDRGMKMKTRFLAKDIERFWGNVEKTKHCWTWSAACFAKGYGLYYAGSLRHMAHRFSWELSNGQIPRGLFVLHHCDNRPCVNPSHLFLGTLLDNNLDMARKGRQVFGEIVVTSKLTETKASEILKKYNTNKYSQARLAREYQMSKTAIYELVRGISWRRVSESLAFVDWPKGKRK